MKKLLYIGLLLMLSSCGQYDPKDPNLSRKADNTKTSDSTKMADSAKMAMLGDTTDQQQHSYHADAELPPSGTVLGDLKVYDVHFTPHLLDDGIDITGSIVDQNDNANYKDAHLKVLYFSKTRTLIDTETFLQYEFYTPGHLVHFKMSGKNLPGIYDIDVVLTDATKL